MKKVIEHEEMVTHTFKISKEMLIQDFGSIENGIKAIESTGCMKSTCGCEDINKLNEQEYYYAKQIHIN